MVTVFSKQNCKRLRDLFKSFPFSGELLKPYKGGLGRDCEWIGKGL